jgi:hypothetical protein
LRIAVTIRSIGASLTGSDEQRATGTSKLRHGRRAQRRARGSVCHMSRFTITVGEATFECSGGRTTSTLNAPDTASGVVAAEDLAERGADWAGPAHASIESDDVMHGRVIEAEPQDDGTVALSLRGATMLSESLLPPMVVQQIDQREVVYLAAREAGFAPDDINIEGLAGAVDFEPLWVLAPIRGLSVRQAPKLGVVELVAGDVGREILRRFTPPLDPKFADPLDDVGAFARVPVPAKYLYDAEQEGLSLIDNAVAWLTTRLRYSWSHAPDERLEPYERVATLTVVERLPGVAVFPVESGGRRWWRDTTISRHEQTVELAPDARWLAPTMPTQMSLGDRQALLALQRAITAHDPVQRVTALWEAIEFYVSDRSPEPDFTDDEIAGAVERAREGLPDAKAVRVGQVLGDMLNAWPIRARFERVLRDEGVPFSDEDVRRVVRLRRARNRALHGAEAKPSHEEIDQAVGLMSRAITTRWSWPT